MLGHLVADGRLDCTAKDCPVCVLHPRPGESRSAWLARLAARFHRDAPIGHCETCGAFKWPGEWCRHCHPYQAGTERRAAS